MSPSIEEALDKAHEIREQVSDDSNTYYDIRETIIENLDIIIDALEGLSQ